jgi:hypothetical protein
VTSIGARRGCRGVKSGKWMYTRADRLAMYRLAGKQQIARANCNFVALTSMRKTQSVARDLSRPMSSTIPMCRICDFRPQTDVMACAKQGVSMPFQAFLPIFEKQPFRGGSISQMLAGGGVSRPMSSFAPICPIFELCPSFDQEAGAEWVATAGFRQTRACAGARRARV